MPPAFSCLRRRRRLRGSAAALIMGSRMPRRVLVSTVAVLFAVGLAVAVVRFARHSGAGGEGVASATLVELVPEGAHPELVGDGQSTKMRAIHVDIPSAWTARATIPRGARFESYVSFARS